MSERKDKDNEFHQGLIEMIDFLKIQVLNPDLHRIKNNSFLEWKQLTNEQTGEIERFVSEFHGLTFEIKNDKYLNISGSVHKYNNSTTGGGFQNYDDFSFADLVLTIKDICNRFDLSPDNCIIHNIEFGVNINPPIPPAEVLKSVINHKGKPFSREYSKNKQFRECIHTRYIIKIYNKGLQYEKSDGILRFENKTITMEHLKKYDISLLSDLLNYNKIKPLGDVLRGNFNELLFYDYTIEDRGLAPIKRLILTQGRNPIYWNDLKETNENNYYKKRQRFRFLVNKYGTLNIQEIIGKLISEKWDELLNGRSKTLQKLIDLQKPNFTEINPYYTVLNPVKLFSVIPKRDSFEGFCLSCGRDISKQKKGSKFCSAKFVGYKLAHKCRNYDSNPWNNLKNMIERDKERGFLFLFDTIPFFIERKQQNLQINQ